MKIGMKEEMGVANEMTSSVLGLRARVPRKEDVISLATPISSFMPIFMTLRQFLLQLFPKNHENEWICELRAQMRALPARYLKSEDVISSATPISSFMPIFMTLRQF